ncbi:MAG: penicillin-binding protein 2 [Lachnospiraceae bacterium]|nr:penicillin-binding protein 2 [Lachnospiraceae bacterium]
MSGQDRRFNKKMQEKLVALFLIVLLAFVGLSIRLISITRDNGEQYKKQVLSQQKYESTIIPFKRGDILDSKGNKLASSEKVYNLVIDSKNMLRKEEYLDATMSALTQCFSEFNETDVRQYINANPSSQYYVTLKQLTYDEIAPFVELMNDTKNNPDIKGVWFEEEYKRVYPNNELACDVIGFTGKDNVGSYGLEQYYNDTLNGVNGREYGYLSEDETLERTVIPSSDGYNIVTTIDGNVQQIVEKYLYEFNEQYKNAARAGNGANNTGCIIMDVNSGEILAMASYPCFNLNDPRNTDALLGSRFVNDKGRIEYEANSITEENMAELLPDDVSIYQNLNYMWKNFCISNTYEPGSVAKPFTVAAGLESGRMTGNEYYTCNGQLHVGDHDIKCHNYKLGGDGTLSVQEAVEKSCNVALMLMGRQIGKTTFLEYQEKFNFGLKTNIDLYGESRTNTLVFNEKNMGETELATSTFGQGYNVTMIQMITAFASLVNGGYYYEPHVVKRITAPDGSTVKNISPRVLKQTVSAATSAKIVQYCNGVVVNGTGKTARPAGYAIGGKTGTAETIPRDKRNYVVSFMGYAPADNPQIAIYVVVDRPNAVYQDDAKYATRIVRSILTEVLPYMNIYMTEELSEKELAELEELDITIKHPAMEEDETGEEGEGTAEETEDVMDANGGDITSSTRPTDEEMQSDNVETAPLTGAIFNIETGQPVSEADENDPE